MKTIAELRKTTYDYHRKYYSYVFNKWKWYSYRKYKMWLYMNTAPALAYFCLKLEITPNAVTIFYAFLGVLGGIFLAIPLKWLVLAGIILYYFRPILDSVDGLIARETGRTSVTGDVLDSYGAFAGWVPLWAGLGLYVANKFGDMGWVLSGTSIATIFFYLTPVIPVLIAINLMTSTKNKLFDDYIVKIIRDNIKKAGESNTPPANANTASLYLKIRKIFNLINSIFEHNARTVDFICLILLLELFLPFFISWVIFLAFLVWQIIYFIASFYLVARGGWAEKELKDKLEQINKDESAS